MKKLFLIIFCTFSLFAFGTEYTVTSIPNPITTNAHAFVSNPDAIIKQETVDQINTILDSLKSQTGAEVAVVVVNSIGQADYFNFATELFKHWGIGKKKQDNGLLILFVLDQKKVKIETGYGLEGILPDAICARIRIQTMNPEFKNGNYDAGLLAGVQRISSIIRKEPVEAVVETPIAWNEILPIAAAAYLILITLSWIWLNNSIQRIRKNTKFASNLARFKAIKSEKTAIISVFSVFMPIAGLVLILFFSQPVFLLLLIPVPFTVIPADIFGRLTMRKIRREPIPCNACGGKMHILSEKEEDKHLKLSQQFEEQLHAIDYDVFLCDSCKNEAIFTLDKPSAYTDCPKCRTKAFILESKRTIVAPTYISGGTQRTTFRCKFCGHEENHNDHIPRLTRTEGAIVGGAIAGSLFSGRGGFGGGGGFSGGSFGGGMSGGGGSGGGW
ncbi:MAG: TPM domain-containing protein [Paludibacter sp.]